MVNDLLAQEYPQGTEKMLRERQAEWNADFVEILGALADDMDTQQRPETAQRLRGIRAQALSMLSPQPTSSTILTP
jgi:hypothetical protein